MQNDGSARQSLLVRLPGIGPAQRLVQQLRHLVLRWPRWAPSALGTRPFRGTRRYRRRPPRHRLGPAPTYRCPHAGWAQRRRVTSLRAVTRRAHT